MKPYDPLDDALFRRMLAECVGEWRTLKEPIPDYRAVPFRVQALRIAKKLRLTRTCELLESNL